LPTRKPAISYFKATELEFEVPTLFVIVTASDSIASMFPRTLNVTAVVKRLPKLWDGVLWYQTLNGPFTGKSRLVVSSFRSGLLGSTAAVNLNPIALTERVGEYPVISTVNAAAVLLASCTELIRGADGRTWMLVAGTLVAVRFIPPSVAK